MFKPFKALLPFHKGRVPFGTTDLQRAIAILRRFGQDAHIYLPGVGMMNGLTAANYLDSAGTTVGTVDQPVGLVLDAAGGLGVDLLSDKSNLNNSTARMVVATPNALGKFYKIINAVGLSWHDGTGVVAITSSPFLVAPQPGPGGFLNLYNASGSTQSLALVEVREVTGIAASQPTTSAKPILRRGAVNLLTYSGDMTLAPWGDVRASRGVDAVTATATSVNGFAIASALVSSGATATAQVELKKGTSDWASVLCWDGSANGVRQWVNLSTGVIASTATLGTGWAISQAEITSGTAGHYILTLRVSKPTGSVGINIYPSTQTDGAYGCNINDVGYVRRVASYSGTYTAQQIQALRGIPLTTTAPASTALGPYWWDTTGGKTLVATFPAGNESVTVIDAKSTGQVTLTGQNVVGAYNVSKQFGPEVVVNGDNEAATFSIGTMQANNTTASKVAAVGGRSGFVLLANSSISTSVSHQYNTQGTVLEANKSYQITMDMYVPTGGVGACRVFDNSDGSFFSLSMTTKDAWVTVSVVRPAKATAWQLGIGNNIPEIITSGLPSFYLDNISVKEVVSDVNGKIIVNGALTTPELTLLQSYANKMAGL